MKLFQKFNGVMPSPPDERDYPVTRAVAAEEPIEIPVSWETWQPPVENQYSTGNCVAQSLANIMECIDHRDGIEHKDRSVGYIYGMSSCAEYSSGMYPRDACAALLKEGDVYRSVWEYLYENPKCAQLRAALSSEITSQAKKVAMYVRLNSEEEARRFMLKYNLPVMVTVKVSEVWSSIWGTGLHALVWYGWDDSKLKKLWTGKMSGNNLHLQNSWGKGGAMGDGTKWTSYDKFKEVWGVVPFEAEPEVEPTPEPEVDPAPEPEVDPAPVTPEEEKEMKVLSNKSLDMAIPFDKIAKMKNVHIGSAITMSMVRDMYPDADIIVNTALFDMATGKLISRIVADGKKYGGEASWAQTWGIAFGDEKGPRLSWDNGVGAPEFIGPYSSCVRDGVIGDGLNDKSKRGRTAIGLRENEFVVVCTPDGSEDAMSTATLCQLMKDKGCSFAINLDGGGSSQFEAPDGRKFSSGRKCPAWLAIWLKKDEAPVEPEDDKKEDPMDYKPEPVKCVCTKKTYTLDSSGKKEGNRYIDPGDACTLNGITENCLIEITYPVSKGTRTAFINSLENFTANPTKA